MVYHFNEEDFGLRMEWIFLGVDSHIMLFLHLHEDIVRSAYDEIITELKKYENNPTSGITSIGRLAGKVYVKNKEKLNI